MDYIRMLIEIYFIQIKIKQIKS